jgi:hypothetical protein
MGSAYKTFDLKNEMGESGGMGVTGNEGKSKQQDPKIIA